MSLQQITWAEINDYDAARLAGLSAWDKLLIRRLDDAYEAARPEVPGQKKTPTVADMKANLRAAIAEKKARDAAKGGEPSPT